MPPQPSARPADAAAQSNSGDRLAAGIALAVIVLAPSLYSFRFMSFGDAKLAGMAAGLLALSIVVPVNRFAARGDLLRLAPAALLIFWGGLVSFLRQDADFSGTQSAAGCQYLFVLLTSICCLVALRRPSRDVRGALVLSSIPVAVLALAQYARLLPWMFPAFAEYDQRMYSVFGNQDLLGGYMALALSLLLATWLTREWGTGQSALCAAPLLAVLALSGSRTAWLASAFGLGLAVLLNRKEWRRSSVAFVLALAEASAVAALAPKATLDRLAHTFAPTDAGYHIRRWIWDGTLHLFSQRPIAGVGAGEFAYYSPRALGEVLRQRGPGGYAFNHLHTVHAHSDVLEIAVETGIVGLALLAAFIILIPRRNSAVWPGLAAAFAFSLMNSTLHSPPHLMAVFLLAGALSRESAAGDETRTPSSPIVIRVVFAAAAILAVGIVALRVLLPSALLASARNEFAAAGEQAEISYARASRFCPSPEGLEDYAVLLANDGRLEDAEFQARKAARGLDTGSLYYLRAQIAERSNARDQARDSYRECALRWPDYAPAYEGLLRTSAVADRAAILLEAGRWLTREEYTSISAALDPAPPRQ